MKGHGIPSPILSLILSRFPIRSLSLGPADMPYWTKETRFSPAPGIRLDIITSAPRFNPFQTH